MLAALIIACLASTNAVAQSSGPPSGTVTISGTVTDEQQRPLGGARIALSGPSARTATTNAGGAFSFGQLPQGVYRIDVTKAGFVAVSQDDVAATAGSTASVKFALRQASFSSLREIGRVVVSRNGATSINTTTSAVSDVSGQTFATQGQLSVTRALNQTPGIVVSPINGFGFDNLTNASNPAASGVPQIRGALPYETESLIDGSPISIGRFGTFNPVFINPYILQDVEVVKGPGASPPNINYAIGGTVNYRTLEPTSRPLSSFDYGIDEFGGQFANVRATGTLPGSRLSYALDYITNATQGPVRGLSSPISPIAGFVGTYINGIPACAANPATQFSCLEPIAPGDPKYFASAIIKGPIALCCPPLPMDFNQRNELAKIRYAFSPQTALTLSYTGGQARAAEDGAAFFDTRNFNFFVPPPGYAGSVAPGPVQFDGSDGGTDRIENNADLFQLELHAPIGRGTFLTRAYSATETNFLGGPGNSGSPAPLLLSGALYGGIPLGNRKSLRPRIVIHFSSSRLRAASSLRFRADFCKVSSTPKKASSRKWRS